MIEVLSRRPYKRVVELTLPANPESVSQARQLIGGDSSGLPTRPRRHFLRPRFTHHENRILTGRQDELVLAMSEMAANAVVHGTPNAEVTAGDRSIVVGVGKERRHRGVEPGVVLYVRDSTAEFGPKKANVGPDSENGRGDGIVETLADRTGHLKTHSEKGLRRLTALFSQPNAKEVYGVFRSETSPLAAA